MSSPSTVRRLRTPSRGELTTLLVAPALPADPLRPCLRETLVAHLQVLGSKSGTRQRLDAYGVERGATGFATSFAWSARASRRALGTAAARAVWNGDAANALRAARDEVDRLCDRAARGLVRPGSLGAWLAGEPEVVRELCALEGASWASSLVSIVRADRDLAVGVPDAWFDVPGGAFTLRGRRDVVSSASAQRRSVLRVRDGAPGSRSVEGLLVDGLVEALASEDHPLPARVVGVWADAGLCLSVEFDDEAARLAARAVVACARALVVPLASDLVPAAA